MRVTQRMSTVLELEVSCPGIVHRASAKNRQYNAAFYHIVMRRSHAYAFALFSALAGCSSAPIITLSNQSPAVISNVVVSGSGFSTRIDCINAGAERKITVHPRGESGVKVTFDIGGRHITTTEQGYFESSGGYRPLVTVQPDTNVAVSVDLRRH